MERVGDFSKKISEGAKSFAMREEPTYEVKVQDGSILVRKRDS
jgi:hypothetical protein